MIELGVIKLTEVLFGLVKYKHSNLLNSLDEVYEAFELVHKDYMESFRNYREMISTARTKSGRAHPVLDAIKKDQLFLADARLKLVGLVEAHESSHIYSELLRKIADYLSGIEGVKIGRLNELRRALMKEIEGIARRNLTSTKYEVGRLRGDANAIKFLHPDHPLRDLAQSNSTINANHVNELIKFEMTLALDTAIEAIQKKYADVIREYYLVKQRLT